MEISSFSPDGDRQLHTVLSPPQLFGELGVLANRPRSTSALAVTDTVVLSVEADAFVRFLENDNASALGVIRALADQVLAFGGLIDDLLFLDLRARVAKRLLGLVTPTFADLPADGTKVPPGVTQADLASLAGGSRENVSRILSDFVRSGLLERTGRGRYVLADGQRSLEPRNSRALPCIGDPGEDSCSAGPLTGMSRGSQSRVGGAGRLVGSTL